MKHYKMTAPDFIAWIRLCRPGSVLGPQQQFLCKMQEKMFKEGEDSPIFENLDEDVRNWILEFSVSFWVIGRVWSWMSRGLR